MKSSPRFDLCLALHGLVLSLLWVGHPSSRAGTMASCLVDSRGYGGVASTNSLVQNASNLPAAAHDERSWSGSVWFGRTDSTGRSQSRAEPGRAYVQAVGTAESEVSIATSLSAQGRGVATASWDDRFVINANSPALLGQPGELRAVLAIQGSLAHTSSRTDAGLYFGVSCLLTDTFGGGSTNFHGGTLLRANGSGVVETLPLNGSLIGPGLYEIRLPFHFGQRISVAVWCQIDADARELATLPAQGKRRGESLGNAQVFWSGMSDVRTAAGALVTDFTTTSDSGFDYGRGTRLTPPTLACVDRVVECGSIWSLEPPAVIDGGCQGLLGSAVLVGIPVTNGPPCAQQIAATWGYTNCWGQIATCTQIIHVSDGVAPVEFNVTTSADSGPGSLRAALDAANQRRGFDTINFAIPGTGPHVIRLLTPLPPVSDPVSIDGFSQPGAISNSLAIGDNARLEIALDGSLIGVSSSGLALDSGGTVVRGLSVSGFVHDGIGIRISSANNVVEGCFVGTDPEGRFALPNAVGIAVMEASGNRIGSADPGSRNVISGNLVAGVTISGAASRDNRVLGNYIGPDATGFRALGNGNSPANGAGIVIARAAWNSIGGSQPGEGNVISGNCFTNLFIVGDSNLVQGNIIGRNASGLGSLCDSPFGVFIGSGSRGTVVGGSNPGAIPAPGLPGIAWCEDDCMPVGAGNVIAGNQRGIAVSEGASQTRIAGNAIRANSVDGIFLDASCADTIVGGSEGEMGNLIVGNGRRGVLVMEGSTATRILGNSIHDNGELGIDLSRALQPDGQSDGPTPNAASDAVSSGSAVQSFPVLSSAELAGGRVLLTGGLNSRPGQRYRLEFFASAVGDPSGFGEGDRLVGSTEVLTDGSGHASFAVTCPALAGRPLYTATATDLLRGTTSEFCRGVFAVACTISEGGDPPSLTLTLGDAGLIARWTGGGFVLQDTENLAGPWMDLTLGSLVEGTKHEARLPLVSVQRFLRLRQVMSCQDSSTATELIRAGRVIPGDLDIPSTPEPTLTWFDPIATLGEPGSPRPAWRYSLGGDRPTDVLVAADDNQVLAVIQKGPETPYSAMTTPRYLLDEVTKVPRFVAFNPPLRLSSAANKEVVDLGFEFFRTFPWMFGTGNPTNQLLPTRVVPSFAGGQCVIFHQIHTGRHVWGCELRVHFDGSRAITSISGRYFRDPGVNATPSFGQGQALEQAVRHWMQATGEDQLPPGEAVPERGLVVLPARLTDPSAHNDIAWWFEFPDADRFVSASNGTNITVYSRQYHVRKVIDMNQAQDDDDPGELQLEDSRRMTSSPLDSDAKSADEAMIAVESFFGGLNQDIWSGANNAIIARVDVRNPPPVKHTFRFGTCSLPTACSSPSDPVISIRSFFAGYAAEDAKDNVAHEFSHTVIGRTAELVYAFEPGAVNESFADVFAKLIMPVPKPWVLGVNLPPSDSRDLAHPIVPSYADYIIKPNTTAEDYGRVHENSGIGSRAAVLLADGDGTPVHPGIGRPQLARIWWETLHRLSPHAGYIDFAAVAWQVTRELAGKGGESGLANVPDPADPSQYLPVRQFIDSDAIEVLWAFRQVGIDLRLQTGWFSLPNNDTQPRVWYPGSLTECPGKLVSDVNVRFERLPSEDRTDSGFLGELRVSTGEISRAFGPLTATITQHGVGTRSREVHVRTTTEDYSDVQGNVVIETSGNCPGPEPVPYVTPVVSHWFDNPFFAGRKYDDLVYLCTPEYLLPMGCTITEIELELVDSRGDALAPRTRWGEPAAVSGGVGARIDAAHAGGRDLSVKVHSWHDFGWVVRYRLIYWIQGGDCSLPPFGFCHD